MSAPEFEALMGRAFGDSQKLFVVTAAAPPSGRSMTAICANERDAAIIVAAMHQALRPMVEVRVVTTHREGDSLILRVPLPSVQP